MKIFPSFLLPCLAWLGVTWAQDGYIYTYDSHTHQGHQPTDTVSPQDAWSVLIRRLELPEVRRLATVEDAALAQIERFGGYRTPLFQNVRAEQPPIRLSVILEGYDEGPLRFPSKSQNARIDI